MAVNKRKVLDSARKYVQKGAKQKALKEYERLLKLDPKDGKVRLEIGDAHRRWGQIDEAVTQYLKVADQYKADGFDARAVAVFKQVLNLDSKRYSAHVSLAELYQRMGLDAEAIAALQTAADGYNREGKKREALELLRKMATLDPSNTTSRLKVADLLKQEGMEGEAVSELEAVAEELGRQGSIDQVVGVYARILELQPRRVDMLTATARALVQMQRPERAEPFAKKAIEADGDNTDHYELLCDIYKALERADELSETTRALARIYRERGDDERAREIMQRLPASEGLDAGGDAEEFVADPDEGEIADDELLDDDFLAADDELEMTDEVPDSADAFGDAFDASEQGADEPFEETADEPEEEVIAQGDPAQLLAEASVYLRYGKRDQAIASLKGVLVQEPDNRDALEKLGDALSGNGDPASAVTHWQRAAELAREANETSAVGVLRDRIAAIDPDAAAAIEVPEPAPSEATSAADEEDPSDAGLELDPPDASAAEAPAADDSEMDFELELDLDDEPAESTAAPVEAAADDADPVLGDEGFEIELDVDEAGGEAEEEPTQSAAEAASASQSTTSSERITEELEEAEFYFNQGLMDEAETIYRRVLETAPNHPTACLRMGEIESSRAAGGDTAVSPVADAAAEAPAPDDDLDLAADVELSAEIDLDAGEPGTDGTTPSEATIDLDGESGLDLAAGDDDVSASGVPADEAEGAFEIDVDDAAVAGVDGVDGTDEAHDAAGASDGLEIDLDASDDDPETAGEGDAVAGLEAASSEDANAVTGADETGAFEIDLDDDGGDLAQAAAEAAAALEDSSSDDEQTAESALSTPTLEQAAEETGEEPEPEPEVAVAEAAEPEPEPVAEEPVRSQADETQPIAHESQAAEDEATFDLAAELRDVFDDGEEEDPNAQSGVLSTVEDGFASIFSEFKKGVSATLSDADTETRYDLGIAYREMGLYEDAIGEFRVCLTSADRMVDSLTMMGLCALDLGRPSDAVSHFEQALAGDELDDTRRAGVSFDLGRAFEQAGDAVRAKAAYESVAEIDPDFPEIQERIQALAYADSSPNLQVDVSAPADDDEGFESFEDLTAEAEADDVEEQAEAFESFDDVVSEAEAAIDDAEPMEPEATAEPEPSVPAEEAEPEAATEPDPDPPEPDDPGPSRPARGRKKKISFV
ncbi:MAG: tetratricopeptide repeat protein [Myxococcota bacterium]